MERRSGFEGLEADLFIYLFMISVGSRDGREGLGLGFGLGREMEETELEEGEACSHQNDDANIDPDVYLSYLDEKLYNVLGHFQKDFEGGVSAENLGAKFGGYGSFLPTYQRSPAWSQPKTPLKIQNHNTPRSPNSLQLEGGHRNSAVSACAPLSVRQGPASTCTAALSGSKASSVHDSVKQNLCKPSIPVGEFTPRSEIANVPANLPDQKTLKVRIKMGSDNLSTQKNAAIYSGLGLDVSPSSSFENSPIESEGLSHEPRDSPDESPTTILRTMTFFPLHGGLLLSPLPNGLIHLTKKEKLPRDNRSCLVPKGGQGSSVMLMDGSYSVKDGNVLGDKRTRASEKKCSSVELKNGNSKDARSSIGVLPKKELEVDTLACEDSARGTAMASDMTREVNKSVAKNRFFSDPAKEEQLEPIFVQEVTRVEKSNEKAVSAGKIWEDKKESSDSDVSVKTRKDRNCKGEQSYESIKSDSIHWREKKASNTELIDPMKQNSEHKATSHEQHGVRLPPGEEHPSYVGKKKSKGTRSHGTPAAEIQKESLRVGSLSLTKNKKSTPAKSSLSNGELENLKLQKDVRKARDAYRDLFGDNTLEQEENELDSLDMRSEGKLKDPEVVEKSTVSFNNVSKERMSGKKNNRPSTSEPYSKVASNEAPQSGNGPIPSAAPNAVVIEDNWVQCDKCHKWRLLPIGTKLENLPEKWLCSMLYWLPGMNRCSISEDETTGALIASYQIPAPVGQNNMQCLSNGFTSGVTPADVRNPGWNHQNNHFHGPSGGKKKHGSKEISDATNQDGPAQFGSSIKNLQPSVRSKSLTDMDQPPLTDELDFPHSRKSSDLAAEKHRHKKKEKHKLLDHYPDGGDRKKSKMKSKRETDQESFRVSKKTKTGVNCSIEDFQSDPGGGIRKEGPSFSSSLPSNMAGKCRPKLDDVNDSLQVSVKKPKDRVQIPLDESLDSRKHDNDTVPQKRKAKDCQDSQIHLGCIPGEHLQDGRVSVEEFSENDHRKEKKAKLSNFEGKEYSLCKSDGGTDKKGDTAKEQQLGKDLGSVLSQRSSDGMDFLKRDLGSLQPSVPTTSSSSKVSSSYKTRTFQEVKGSPVESVSSSPLRILHPDKLSSAGGSLVGKDGSQDGGFLTQGSPRRCSDGEDDGGSDRSATARKDKSYIGNHRGSLESSVLNFQDTDLSQLVGSKAKEQAVASRDFTNHPFNNGSADTLAPGTQYPSEPHVSDQCREAERRNDNHYHANGFYPRKSGKGSSSRSKDKNRNSKSEFDKGKISHSYNETQEHEHHDQKVRDRKNKMQEKSGVNSDTAEKKYADKRDSAGKSSSKSSKRESHSKFGGRDGPDLKVDVISNQNTLSTPKQKLLPEHDGERSSKRFISEKIDRVEIVSGRGKSLPLPPSGGGQIETLPRTRVVPGSHKGNGAVVLSVGPAEGDDVKVSKHIRKADNQNGSQHVSSRHPTPNGHRISDLNAPSPVRRDSSSLAATNALKEAKNLKHMADRLKNCESNLESIGLYFQAALKFLHGASLLESCNSESAKQGELIQSMQIYSSTAKLCEFCAHEYEKSKDMAAAALAYKCMEVAYMRVIYSSHNNASRDRHELQTALQMVPPGESPSSSASDIDNLNNTAMVDKVAIAKGVSSPQVTGNHVIAARNRPNFVRLLNFAQDVNFAMEASRKSRIAFAAANVGLEEARHRDVISSIRRALDFNFQDVEGLLRLVKLAMDAISH